jgi:uroporphyrinogen III methyltransferase/synthase
VPVYRTVLETEGADEVRALLAKGELDAITFTSSSTVRNFVTAMGEGAVVPAATKLISIGPVTAETCAELLRAPDHTADTYTIDGLMETLLAAFPVSDS